jgi:hypothetical protein
VKKKCSNCINFFTSNFCGYNACNCKIYGSLDVDQKERHPDTAALTCKDFMAIKTTRAIAVGYETKCANCGSIIRFKGEDIKNKKHGLHTISFMNCSSCGKELILSIDDREWYKKIYKGGD